MMIILAFKILSSLTLEMYLNNRQNRLRFAYTHFKSCDQYLDKTSVDFSNIFRVMHSCTMNAKVA